MKYLRAHGRGHKYQRAIPAALQPMFGGKKLKTVFYDATVSGTEAQRRALVQWSADSEEFERLLKLSIDERQFLVDAGGIGGAAQQADAWGKSIASSKQFLADVDEIELPPPSVDKYGRRIEITRDKLAAMAVRYRAHTRALEPYVVKAATVVAKASRKAPTASNLTALLDLWQVVVAPRDPRAREKYGKSLSLFVEAVGDMVPEMVTSGHAAQFRDWLGERGMGQGAQQKALDHVRAIFSAAKKDGKLPGNPFSGINPRKPQGWKLSDKKKRHAFTAEEVRTIFANLNKLTGITDIGARSADVTWAIKLAIYHGMRINEACGLRKADVRKINGVWILDINDEERRIKNAASLRVVPLHPKCAAFATYATKARGPWVFGALTDYKEGGRGGWIIRHFGIFLDQIGITRPKVTLHSLRHRWIDAARNAGVPEDVRRAIAGHEGEAGAHGDYGDGFDVAMKLKWLRKVDPTRD